MTATIKIKNSSTASAVPGSGDLVQGELAVNVTDKKIYTKNASGTIVNLGTTPSITDNGNAEAIVIASSENVGIGVSPSASGSFMRVLQVGDSGYMGNNSGTMRYGNNFYIDSGGTSRYIRSSSNAHLYAQDANAGHIWSIAPSGTAGDAITFTQAMTLDASGNLGVNNTSPTTLITSIGGSGGKGLVLAGAVPVLYFEDTNGTDASIYVEDGNIGFVSGTTERARIDTSGNLLVGKTTAGQVTTQGMQLSPAYAMFSANNGSTDPTMYVGALGTSGYFVKFYYSTNGVVGQIYTSGTTTTYGTSSDYRLKDISGELTGYKERLLALQPKQGSWKVDGSEFRGFLAHEFAQSYPASVNGEKDAVDKDGNPEYQGMQAGSSEVIADLVAYIQELETRLAALENK